MLTYLFISDSAGSPTAPTTDSHTDGTKTHDTNVKAQSRSTGHVNTNTDNAIATEGNLTTSTGGDSSSPAVRDQGQVDGGFERILGGEDQEDGMEIDKGSSNGESAGEKDIKNHIESRLGPINEDLDNPMHDIGTCIVYTLLIQPSSYVLLE